MMFENLKWIRLDDLFKRERERDLLGKTAFWYFKQEKTMLGRFIWKWYLLSEEEMFPVKSELDRVTFWSHKEVNKFLEVP